MLANKNLPVFVISFVFLFIILISTLFYYRISIINNIGTKIGCHIQVNSEHNSLNISVYNPFLLRKKISELATCKNNTFLIYTGTDQKQIYAKNVIVTFVEKPLLNSISENNIKKHFYEITNISNEFVELQLFVTSNDEPYSSHENHVFGVFKYEIDLLFNGRKSVVNHTADWNSFKQLGIKYEEE